MLDKWDKAIDALLSTKTREEAANIAGITSKTLREYFKKAEFVQRYNKARGELVRSATVELQKNLSHAVAALVDIVKNKDGIESNRISAARTLLEYGLKLSEVSDIYERIEALEGAQDAKNKYEE